MKGFDKMANIIKRGTSYRATVSIYKNSENQRITKTFKTQTMGFRNGVIQRQRKKYRRTNHALH